MIECYGCVGMRRAEVIGGWWLVVDVCEEEVQFCNKGVVRQSLSVLVLSLTRPALHPLNPLWRSYYIQSSPVADF